ncbi:MAG: DMT family transporter [Chitinophagaceae bacterium]|nr:DMT family transporter [Chitinophagaceae bacterium]MBK8300919.1 DMT family transporter [Chitinophagaceae bacterium]MBK9660393.1 DMT family transporter [Chitinophagaceae bacterium]MBK9938275.1 DMT family transporter [Chitinophagaceae bacterium]
MSNKFISWSIFVILCLIWGSSFKLMHDSQLGLSAAQIAALRIFSAGLVFVPFAVFHFSKIPKKKLGIVTLSAVFGNLLPAFLFAEAITKLDSSLAGILNSLTPICVVAVGIFFFKDKIKSQKILGVFTGFIGLVLLTVLPMILENKSMSFSNMGYTLLIVVATFLYGINVNMVGHYLKGLNPIHIATVSLAFMTIPAGIILWQQGFFHLDFKEISVQESVWASVGLGIGGSAIATALFYILVQKAGILFASLVTYGIPFIALLWGLYDHEKITWVQPLCLGIILFGVYLANRPDKKESNTV